METIWKKLKISEDTADSEDPHDSPPPTILQFDIDFDNEMAPPPEPEAVTPPEPAHDTTPDLATPPPSEPEPTA